ncbi:hypothetical protein Nepgr_001044 [Nepenthes gracilis]|uniref:Uncharacterized protein n=1 Tax=Nepenthes gracilis TaxID=150966 RepID=A0AAD3P2A6_NEPGR|nr:hypothetical protein Nepgr_001044 [Nepenthes gracilis]
MFHDVADLLGAVAGRVADFLCCVLTLGGIAPGCRQFCIGMICSVLALSPASMLRELEIWTGCDEQLTMVFPWCLWLEFAYARVVCMTMARLVMSEMLLLSVECGYPTWLSWLSAGLIGAFSHLGLGRPDFITF